MGIENEIRFPSCGTEQMQEQKFTISYKPKQMTAKKQTAKAE